MGVWAAPGGFRTIQKGGGLQFPKPQSVSRRSYEAYPKGFGKAVAELFDDYKFVVERVATKIKNNTAETAVDMGASAHAYMFVRQHLTPHNRPEYFRS